MTQKENNHNLPQELLKINSYLNNLKPAERKVAEYILKNFEKVIHLSITRMAEEVGVSEATIVKLCQRMGYSGYQELKIKLAQIREDDKQSDHIYSKIEPDDELEVIIKKIFQIYDNSLTSTQKLISKDKIEKSVELIKNSQRIFFFGYGASGIVAADAELKFKRINYIAQALTDNHNQKTAAALLDEEDLIVAISNSGQTKELIETLQIAREMGAKIIVITSNMGSPVTEFADIVLLTYSIETPFRGSALASRMAQLSIIDVIFLGVAADDFEETNSALERTRVVMQDSKVEKKSSREKE